MPLRQSLAVGRYLVSQRIRRRREVPAARRARAALPVQSRLLVLREDPVPGAHPPQAHAGRHGARRDRGVRRADGLDRRRRAARPSRGARDRAGARRAQEVRVPLHERDPDEEAARALRAVEVLHVGRASRRAAGAPRRVRRAGRCLRHGRGGDPRGQGARVPGEHEHDLPLHRYAEDRARGARLPQRRARGRRDPDLPRVRVREGARPGALPRSREDALALPRGVRRRRSASAGASTTRRCSSTSSRARSTSSARRGASRATRSSAGSARAT